jgi:hypothetical protein
VSEWCGRVMQTKVDLLVGLVEIDAQIVVQLLFFAEFGEELETESDGLDGGGVI